jgi:rubrerythrin
MAVKTKTSVEMSDLLDTAIYKEIASQTLYIEAQRDTDDAAARMMLRRLADEELKHAETLKKLKEAGWKPEEWSAAKVAGLGTSDYLRAPDTLAGAGLQEVMIFAMKREQQSMEFYTQMMDAARLEEAKGLCARLTQEELKHKMKLELEYERMFPEKEY